MVQCVAMRRRQELTWAIGVAAELFAISCGRDTSNGKDERFRKADQRAKEITDQFTGESFKDLNPLLRRECMQQIAIIASIQFTNEGISQDRFIDATKLVVHSEYEKLFEKSHPETLAVLEKDGKPTVFIDVDSPKLTREGIRKDTDFMRVVGSDNPVAAFRSILYEGYSTLYSLFIVPQLSK